MGNTSSMGSSNVTLILSSMGNISSLLFNKGNISRMLPQMGNISRLLSSNMTVLLANMGNISSLLSGTGNMSNMLSHMGNMSSFLSHMSNWYSMLVSNFSSQLFKLCAGPLSEMQHDFMGMQGKKEHMEKPHFEMKGGHVKFHFPMMKKKEMKTHRPMEKRSEKQVIEIFTNPADLPEVTFRLGLWGVWTGKFSDRLLHFVVFEL